MQLETHSFNLASLEKRLIEKSINLHGFYNRPKVYESLGLSERTFYNKLKQHNIPLPGKEKTHA